MTSRAQIGNRAQETSRILIVLDSYSEVPVVLRAAATLASRLQAELFGLFIEDVNLLQLARLPFARELGATSGLKRALDGLAMERSLRAQAQRFRGEFASLAAREHIRWQFHVARGEFLGEVVAASLEADLVLLSPELDNQRRFGRPQEDSNVVVGQMACSVVLLRPGAVIERPVAVLFDGSESSLRALAMAARLAGSDGQQLVVLIAAGGADAARALERRSAEALGAAAVRARYRYLASTSFADLLAALQVEGGRLLVLSALLGSFPSLDPSSLLRHIPVPIVLVR